MEKLNIKSLGRKKAITLTEIMIALLILAFAFLPIVGVIGTSAKDTDVANSYVFAQTTARNILDTLLDDVPFNSIRTGSGNIATLHDYGDYKIDSFQSMIGTIDENASGSIMDERGTSYEIKIYVFPIPVTQSSNVNTANELLFAYLPRPKFEGETSEAAQNWYTFSSSDRHGAYSPDGVNPYATDKIATTTIGAYELGARPNANSSEYYIMKKILFQMTWKGRDNHERRLELYTMKANLDSEVNR